MKLTEKLLIDKGFETYPFYESMQAYKKDGLLVAKRKDLRKWRCYVSQGWHKIETTEQLDLLLQITKS